MKSYPNLSRLLSVGISVAVFSVLLIVGLNAPSGSEDKKKAEPTGSDSWPLYGGSLDRNMVSSGAAGLPSKWDINTNENIKWVADLGSKSYGGPVILDGRVIVGTNNQKPRDPKWVKGGKPVDLGVLMCFDQKNGNFLWQAVHEKLKAGLVHDWPREGICSTPVLEGDKIYYVSNRCEVVCAEVKTGKPIWKLDMMGKLGVFPHNIAAGSPLIKGDRLFVVTANGVDEAHINVPAPKAPSFLCLNKKNGAIIWQSNLPSKSLLGTPKAPDQKQFFKNMVNKGKLLQHGQWSNPAYGVINGEPQVIFPGGDGWIYAFKPDSNKPEGELIWKFDCNPKDAVYELGGKGTRNDFIATPVIYKNRVYIGVGQDPEHETGVGHLWCIDMTKKGDVSPEIVTDDAAFPPKTKKNPNSALLWHYGGKADPNKIQRNYYFGRTMSTCAIKDDLVYACDIAGILHCLDAKTGEHYWEFDTFGTTWSSPYWADNKIYIGNDASVVYVFAHGKKQNLLSENDMDGRVRATPIAVGDTLYVMTENKLYAISKKN